ncbi:MAG: DinB family protein [Bacteroidota bacterium]
MHTPTPEEYHTYYAPYVQLVPETDLREGLAVNWRELQDWITGTPESKGTYRYAEGKWSVNELLLHLGDAERVFAYRALCIARGDQTPLPGFDHDVYVANSAADGRSLKSILEELRTVREATRSLFQNLGEEQLLLRGTASGVPISVRALAYLTIGHTRHHLRILQERYA